MLQFAALFITALAISLLSTPLVRKLAIRWDVVDRPSDRKIHKTPTPLLGGIPIFLGFNVALVAGLILDPTALRQAYSAQWAMFLLAQVLVLGIGIYDDKLGASPGVKFLFQVAAGASLLLGGFGIRLFTNPFSGTTISLGGWWIPVTLLWFVGISNAINLIDGLDGLAAGVAFLASLTIFAISLFYQKSGVSILALMLVGSVLGFLRYNYPPARIFLGDSGSLLLGLLLAVLSLEGTHKGAVVVTVLAPILILGLPILDTVLAMLRRLARAFSRAPRTGGKTALRGAVSRSFSMFEADRDHIHHRILKIGFSHKRTLFVLYGVCVALCILSFVVVSWKNLNMALFVGAVVVAIYIGIRRLQYKELSFLRNGMFLNILNFPIFNKKIFQAFVDLIFVGGAFYLSNRLTFGPAAAAPDSLFFRAFPAVLLIKIVVFSLAKLYRGMWRYSRAEDLIRIVKAVFLSSAASVLLLRFVYQAGFGDHVILHILDFYFVLTLVSGARVSYKLFFHYYHLEEYKKKILIYGAGAKGASLLAETVSQNGAMGRVLGFLDDDANRHGTDHMDHPILGGLDGLESILEATPVDEIQIATGPLPDEKLKRLKAICAATRTDLREFVPRSPRRGDLADAPSSNRSEST